jgi:phosphatidylglycerophosphatase A
MTSPGELLNPNSSRPTIPAEPSLLIKLFASALFTGYSPIASGTFGSLVGLALYFIPGFEQPYLIIPACILVFAAGVKASETMERRYGHDPAEVTVDEVVGMWISLLLLPKSLVVAGIGFFIFRILDIVKPFPAKRFDNKKGGLGIMMDDVIAAVYTNVILHFTFSLPLFRQLL